MITYGKYLKLTYNLLGGKFYLIPDAKKVTAVAVIVVQYRNIFADD